MTAQAPVHTQSLSNSTPTEGLGVIDDIYRSAVAVSNGDFGGIITAIQSARSGMLQLEADPVDFFSQMAVGFILEHVDPLKNMLNDFTGDSAEVFGMSASWQSIAESLASIADEIDSSSSSAMSNMTGQAVDAYLYRQQTVSEAMRAVGENASAFSGALTDAANIVDAIHDLVRDAISDVVASLVSTVFWSCVTFGFAAPAKSVEVSAKVTTWVVTIGQIGQMLVQLLQAIKAVFDSFDSIQTGLTEQVKVIGANCSMPTGGCCGSNAAAQDLSSPLSGNGTVTTNGQTGGTNVAAGNGGVAVGGDNNGTINNGGTVNNDNSTTNVDIDVNPTYNGGSSGHTDAPDDDSKGGKGKKPDKGKGKNDHSGGSTGSSAGQSGQGSKTPKKPKTPKTPETPKKPKTPETPKKPKTPKTPETPKKPKTPKTPKMPKKPKLKFR